MPAVVRLKFTVIRPDGLDRETKVGDGEENNAIIQISGDWESISNLAVGDFSLAECRLLLGSEDADYRVLKRLCESPELGSDDNTVVNEIYFSAFEAWIKTYKNNNAFTFAYEQ